MKKSAPFSLGSGVIVESFLSALIAVCLCTTVLGAEATRPPSSRYEMMRMFDAMALAQGYGTDGKINQAVQNELYGALLEIDAEFAEVRDIQTSYYDRLDYFTLFLNEESQKNLAPYVIRDADGLPALKDGKTGIDALDALNAKYGAQIGFGGLNGLGIMVVSFPGPVDLVTLGKMYTSIPEVVSAGPLPAPQDPGGSFTRIYAAKISGGWRFVFSREGNWAHGGNKFYYFTYHVDGKVVSKIDELTPDAGNASGFTRWGIPRRHSIMPFSDYADLISKTEDDTWWIQLHAVDVVGRLLSNPDSVRYAEEEEGHFDQMKDDIAAHRMEAMLVLVDALSHVEEGVREVAHRHLVAIASESFAVDEDGRKRWKRWIKKNVK